MYDLCEKLGCKMFQNLECRGTKTNGCKIVNFTFQGQK